MKRYRELSGSAPRFARKNQASSRESVPRLLDHLPHLPEQPLGPARHADAALQRAVVRLQAPQQQLTDGGLVGAGRQGAPGTGGLQVDALLLEVVEDLRPGPLAAADRLEHL